MAKPRQKLSAREKGLILALFREGKTDAEVAKVIGLQRETFRKVAKYNGLSCTTKRAKGTADDKVERSLYERACGYSHPAVKIFCQGAMVTREDYIEHYPPDTAALIFWLCNRQPERWKNVQHIEAQGLAENFAAVVRAIRDENAKKKSDR